MLWWDEINVLYDRLQINRIIRKYFVLCQNRHTYSWQLQPLGFESRASKKSVCFFLQSHFIERWKETTAIWMIPFFLPNSFFPTEKKLLSGWFYRSFNLSNERNSEATFFLTLVEKSNEILWFSIITTKSILFTICMYYI